MRARTLGATMSVDQTLALQQKQVEDFGYASMASGLLIRAAPPAGSHASTHLKTSRTPVGIDGKAGVMSRILLVACNKGTAQTFLEDAGHQIFTAVDGRDAEAYLDEEAFDFVLLCMSHPARDALLARLQEHHAGTRIVALGSTRSYNSTTTPSVEHPLNCTIESSENAALLNDVCEAAQTKACMADRNLQGHRCDNRRSQQESEFTLRHTDLFRSEALLRALFESASDMVFVHGFHEEQRPGPFILVNDLACRQLHYTFDEMLALSPMDIVAKEEAGNLLPDAEILSNCGAISARRTLISKSGRRIPADISSHAVEIEGETLAFSIARDISERNDTAEKLRQSKERFREMFEHMSSGVAIYRAVDDGDDFVLVDFNSASERINEISREKVIGHRLTEVFPGVREFGIFDVLKRVWQTGKPEHFPIAHYEDNRIQGWRENYIYRLASGEIVAIYDDVTERKQTEEGLRQYKNIVSNSHDLLALLDRNFIYLAANRTYLTAFGKTRDELIGHSARELFGEEYFKALIEPHATQCMTGKKVHYDAWFDYPAYGRQYMSVVYAPYFDAEGDVAGYVVDGRNITARKQAEELLERECGMRALLLDNIPGCMALILENGSRQIVASNKLAREAGAEPGKTCFETLEVCRQGCTFCQAPQLWETGQMQRCEVELEGKWYELIWSPLSDDQYVHYVFDISERKRAEVALQNALKELSQLKEQAEAENIYLRREISMAHSPEDIVCESDGMKAVIDDMRQVAMTDSTVLIQGETGTGKELVARAIHKMSPRKEGPLVIVNCAAMPSSLMESELFGHEKGAYTGAVTRQIGRFEIADGGTIVLDEIGELSGELQAKLLRVLQERQVERLGNPKPISVNVRVIAATNRDLEKLVEEDLFRKDLFYRLNVFPITVPPLRERRDGIVPLAWAFVNEFSVRMGKEIKQISRSAENALMEYSWPGNVRELRNVIERAMIMSKGGTLDIPPQHSASKTRPAGRSLADMERTHIMEVLDDVGWRVRGKGGAAEVLELNPSTLESRMKKLGIKRVTQP